MTKSSMHGMEIVNVHDAKTHLSRLLARVDSFAPASGASFALLPPDNATGNFTKVVQRVPVRVKVMQGCGADRPLRPGMSVVAHVETK